jgi:hypothetical protein
MALEKCRLKEDLPRDHADANPNPHLYVPFLQRNLCLKSPPKTPIQCSSFIRILFHPSLPEFFRTMPLIHDLHSWLVGFILHVHLEPGRRSYIFGSACVLLFIDASRPDSEGRPESSCQPRASSDIFLALAMSLIQPTTVFISQTAQCGNAFIWWCRAKEIEINETGHAAALRLVCSIGPIVVNVRGKFVGRWVWQEIGCVGLHRTKVDSAVGC